MFCFVIDFTFSSEACGAGAASGGGGGGSGGGRGSSLDQDCLGGSVACEEHEVASLTTLHLDSETSSLSHTVTVTGNAHNEAAMTTTKLFKQFLKVLCITSTFTVILFFKICNFSGSESASPMHSLGCSRSQTPSPATLIAEHANHSHSHSHTHLQLDQKLHNSVLQTPDDLGNTHSCTRVCRFF